MAVEKQDADKEVLYYSLWLFLSGFLVCYTDWRFSSQF